MEKYYPVLLNIVGKLCVVVGGGAVAARKAVALQDSGALVRVVSPELVTKLKELARSGRLQHLAQNYDSGTLEGAFLVIAAASPPEINRRVAADCAQRGILLNVVPD